MIQIKISGRESLQLDEPAPDTSLLEILRSHGIGINAPCGGRGTCGKCRVRIDNEGEVLACEYHPDKDIEVTLPGEEEAVILVHQTDFLEDLPFDPRMMTHFTLTPYGIAMDLGTTTVVLYFLNLATGRIEKISSFLNPQRIYGADVITRITWCQEHSGGLSQLQGCLLDAINAEILSFGNGKQLMADNFEMITVAGTQPCCIFFWVWIRLL